MTHADTDGLLDRCHCGAVAGFEYYSPEHLTVRARCTECCEQTDWCSEKWKAVVAWNLTTRKESRK